MKYEHEQRVTMAYMTAYWTNQWQSKKKPERLEKILNRKTETKCMTDNEMFNRVKLLHKALGGE